jgi:uncharacterized protein YciI
MCTRAELRQSGEAMRRRLFGNAGDGGVFLIVGSLQPNLGGGILASNTSRSDLQSRVDTDPFVVEKVVKAVILEIAPAKADTRLDFLLH